MSGTLEGTTSQLDDWQPGGAGSSGLALGTGTGQHGTQLIGGSMGNPFAAVWHWINQPFVTPLSPVAIVGIMGAIILGGLFWSTVIYHVRIAGEAL